jgi:endonuclease III
MAPASKTLRTAAPRSRAAGAAALTVSRRSRIDRAGVDPVDRRTVGRVLGLLRHEASGWNAPVMALEAAERGDPFRVLIGCILSLRTRDETTAEAAPRLFAQASTPQAMLRLSEEAISRLIYPVGFYRTKAAVIVGICRELISRFGARVPDSIDALLTLKGVGRKTANLVVTQAYSKPGICVDTHVHRISNRWGLVRTRTPDETETALRAALPRRYWIEYNSLLVAFGQTICQPLSPWCSRCAAARLCPRVGVSRAR